MIFFHHNRRRQTLAFSTFLILLVCTGCFRLPVAQRETTPDPCAAIVLAVKEARQLLGRPGNALPLCQSLTRHEFVQIGSELLAAEVTTEELEIESRIFKRIGLIPSDYSYAACIFAAYTREASAFYSPTRNTIFIPNWFDVPFPILVHEAVHFLQREQVDFSNDERFRGIFTDSALALGAMLEGEALNVEDRYLGKLQAVSRQTALPESFRLKPQANACEIPLSIKRLFYFQYDYGALFWPRINRMFPEITRDAILSNPPLSTSEIIDPKAYVQRVKKNKQNGVQAKEGQGCKSRGEGNREIGEYALRSLLETVVDPHTSFLAARGLKSDCITLGRDADSEFIVQSWNLSFDTDHDVQEASKALQVLLSDHDATLTTGKHPRELVINYSNLSTAP